MDGKTLDDDTSSSKCQRTFIFTFNNGNNQQRTLRLQLDITEPQNCVELTSRVAGHHKIPCFVEAELKNALQGFIEEERIKLSDNEVNQNVTSLKNKPDTISKIAKSVSAKYKKSWAQFTKTDVIREDEQFSTMYHKLIHSKAMRLLLSLEEHYYHAVQKILNDEQSHTDRLREMQELEMQRTCEHISVGSIYTEEDVNKLAIDHSVKMEKLVGEFKAKYSKLIHNQRKEYRGVVSRFYSEMMANNGKVDENAQTYIEVHKVVEVSERAKEYRLNTMNDNPMNYNQSPGKKGQRQNGHRHENGDSLEIREPTSHRDAFNLRLEESFTINLGAQMKTMHNIRLVAAPPLHFCRHSNQTGDLQAQRLQTVLSLYSNSLSGIVMLVDENIDSTNPLKADFASVCEGSAEFHFPSYEEQVEEIKNKRAMMAVDQSSVKSDDSISISSSSSEKSAGCGEFNIGDLYVTKHSNLSRVHVVFHLVANTVRLKAPESATTVSSRHPVIIGLRNILKIMSSHDVATLMIPILLCHKLNENVDEAWIVKRAELVMKCMKGFMMEMATCDGGISRTIQFVLPPEISDQTFFRLSAMLPEIFRTTTARNLTSPRKIKHATTASPKPARR